MRGVVVLATCVVAVSLSAGVGAGGDAAAATSARIVRIENPVWSPKRAEIAFDARYDDATSEVLIAAPDGSALTQVEQAADPLHRARRPLWSPNGNQLALMGFDGRTPFVAVATRLGSGPPAVVGFGEAVPESWSPASDRLVLNGVDPTNSPTGVAVVDISGARSVTEWRGSAPAWSPRRDVIAYAAAYRHRSFVYTANPQGKQRRRLLPGSNPSWSSDGKLLAYVARGGVWVARANGRDRRLVLHNRAIGGAEVEIPLLWAPHRRLIAVDYWGGTIIIDVAHSRHHRLRLPAAVANRPSWLPWSPDGRRLVFAAGSRLYIVGADGSGGHFVAPRFDRNGTAHALASP